ncbi:MAG: hypothetical protein IKN17_05785 [Ruminococcus sp.]|nr:hypothetical protein [Ruminococcus sp.]
MIAVVVIIFVAVLLLIVSSIVIVPADTAYIVERLGTFHAVYREGYHFTTPFLDKIVAKISLAKQDLVLDREMTVSADGTQLRYSVFVAFRVIDPEKSHYSVTGIRMSLSQLTRSTANSIIGHLPAGEASDSLVALGKTTKKALSAAVEQWGLLIEDISFSELYQI